MPQGVSPRVMLPVPAPGDADFGKFAILPIASAGALASKISSRVSAETTANKGFSLVHLEGGLK